MSDTIINIYNCGGGSQWIAAPEDKFDFSGLPGGMAPTEGVYFAPRDAGTLWVIAANDDQWRTINKDNPDLLLP